MKQSFGARVVKALAAPVAALALAVIVSSIALLLAGYSPAKAFRVMWEVMDSTESIVIVINKAVPFYVAGVAAAIGFKMGLFNIGTSGQYRLAALLAGAAGAAVHFPPVVHVLFILVVAMAVGAAWAAIAGILKVTRGVNEVVSTIMLNFIAVGLSSWLLSTYLRNRNVQLVAETRTIPRSGRLPTLNRFVGFFGFHFDDGVFLHGFLPIAILLGIGYYVLLNRSRFGFELRASGINPSAARASGVNPKKLILITIMLSGAVAGLIGMSALIADPQFFKYGDQFPQQLGFTGIGIALLGRNHPVGIAAAAIVWGVIERATQALSINNLPQEIGVIMQGTLLLSAMIAYEIVRRRNEEAAVRQAAAQTHQASGPPPATGVLQEVST
jgi:simple sugar transport system permease protein